MNEFFFTIKKMIKSKNAAQIFTVIFSPVSIALYSTIIFSVFPPTGQKNYNIIVSIILGIFFLCIFPIIGILYLYFKGKVDLWVSDQKTRTPLYIAAIIAYIIGAIVFHYIDYKIMFVLTIAYVSVTFVVMLTNLFTKVSSHTAGVVGPITALAIVYGIVVFPMFIMIPATMWARYKLKAHDLLQLITGALIASIITSIVYIFLL